MKPSSEVEAACMRNYVATVRDVFTRTLMTQAEQAALTHVLDAALEAAPDPEEVTLMRAVCEAAGRVALCDCDREVAGCDDSCEECTMKPLVLGLYALAAWKESR